jgi:hypothetical protein
MWRQMYQRPIVYPRASLALARILTAANPKMTPVQGEKNATQIIQALHKFGLQVGPLATFGPHDSSAGARDAFDNFDQMLQSIEERDPWHELR